MRKPFAEAILKYLAPERCVFLTGDLGFMALEGVREAMQSRFINAGVAEQNMTLVATGMAMEGHIVFTYSIGNFPTLRCLEMIRNDAAYHDANVKIVSVGGGFSYGPLGISHHATEDIAIMRALPGVISVVPTSLWEVAEGTKAVTSASGTCFLRLDKDHGPDGSPVPPFLLGQPRVLREGMDVAFVVTGGILSEVVKASEELDRLGVRASIYSVHTIKPFLPALIVEAARTHKAMVTVEEHTIHGGLGGMVLEALASANSPTGKFLRIGLDGCFSSVVGSQSYLRRAYGMDAGSIVRRTRELLA